MGAPRNLKMRLAGKPDNPDPVNLESAIEEMNRSHAVVMLGGKCVVMNEVVDPLFHRPDITFSSPMDFKNRYANLKIFLETESGSVKPRALPDLWLQHKKRRTYSGIVFAPGQDIDGYYNLYRGLARNPVAGNWSRLRAHIVENVCGGEQEYYEYLFDWMADLVQDPGGRGPGVSIVMRGGRGTGKSLFATAFGEIFGSHFLHLRDQGHLLGRFNAHHKDALLLFADECFWAGNKTSEGLLKGLITEKTTLIEAKGKDAVRVANHIRLIVASNDDWVVPAGLDERRFFCLDVSSAHKQSIAYWNPIWEETRNGGIEAMLYDLLHRKYDAVKLRTPPRTAALLFQIERSMKSIEQWWYSCLREGATTKENFPWTEKITTHALHTSYIHFCQDINERYPEPAAIFAKSIRRLCPGALPCRISTSPGGHRPMGYIFPDLNECRQRFQTLMNLRVEWEDEF